MREDDPRLPGGGDEPPDPNGAPSDGSMSLYEAVAQIYRTALGREGSPDEINGWIAGKRPDQLAEIQQAIYASDEAKAYGATKTGTPPPTTPPPPPTGGKPAGPGPFVPPTNAPLPDAPTFTSPSVEDALKDSGYQFREQQGERSLQNWAAAKGTLNDSGTAKALIDYGQSAAQQGYADVWNRDYSVFQGNTGIWNTKVAATEHDNDMNYTNAWNRFLNSQSFYEWLATH